jgi:hypothetical protein
LLVFGKRALLDWLAVQLRSQIFRAGKLRGGGFAAVGVIARVRIFAGQGSVGAGEGESERNENRRNAGEQLVEKILACQHPRLAYFAPAFRLTLGHLKVAATDRFTRL